MASYFQDPTANTQMNRWNEGWAKDGPKCPAFFNRQIVPDEEVAAREGRPMFKEVDFIKKFTPGDPTNIVHREVWPNDLEEYPQEWARYKAGVTQTANGTPLEAWPMIDRGRVEELKAIPGAPVHTVEQLAEMTDGILQRFMGLRKFRDLARDWLRTAKEGAPVAELRAELDKRDQQLEELRRQLEESRAEFREQMAALKAERDERAPDREPPPATSSRRGRAA
jgi:hypothetical protein